MIGSIAAMAAALSTAPMVTDYQDVALSPAGDKIASVDTAATGEETSLPHGVIVIRSAASGEVESRIDPCAACFYSAPRWSPNGDTLAFLSADYTTLTARLQLWKDGKVSTVAELHGVAGEPRWSPDGSSLSFLATVNAAKKAGAGEAAAALTGDIGAQYDEQRIAVVPTSGGEVRFASPADTYVYEYDWTPDGRGFVGTAAKGNGDNNWWVAKLEAFDLATGSARVIAAPKTQMMFPRVAPDGKAVMFVGGLMSDFGSAGGDLYRVPIGGGEAVDLTPGFKGTFTSIVWNTRAPIATALVGEKTEIIRLDAQTGKPEVLWSGPVSLFATVFNGRVSLNADASRVAAEVVDFEHPAALAAGPIGDMKRISHDNDAVAPTLSARSVHWKNGGYDIQGWLLGPRRLTPGKTYPMIVQAHGGPSAAAIPYFMGSGTTADLIAHGYFVFLPNPRGSFGQGETFTRANIRDFGGGDFSDILAGVDAAEKVAPIDDNRLGINGNSYGAVISMWAVTHSARFKAAVAGAGISDWMSYYGENGIDEWLIPFFGASAYDDPAIYDKLSAIRYIKNAHTPTFLWVGERDQECPPPQSQEFWHGLRDMGVPTELVIYPGEGHGVRQPKNVHDLEKRILDWYGKYLGE
ncbi:MAG TPA: S9 family peptidase [Caulobacteraceae bacterium]|jgi:dipeptidyl aminopeptidase/acylaminoacyl peptidase|nr:S9 family peptidase [Caulobacteraceae bacterium]